MANPQMTAAVEARVKKYGQWSVKEEKLRIIYDDSEESVLFEDTSSISYLKVENINPLYMFGGILLGCILGIVSMTSGDDVGLGMILMVGIMILRILNLTTRMHFIGEECTVGVGPRGKIDGNIIKKIQKNC